MGREKRLALTTEADLKNRSGLTDGLAQSRIFNHQAKHGEIEQSVKSRP